jgi:hypothetical protein
MDQTKFSLEIVCPQGNPHQVPVKRIAFCSESWLLAVYYTVAQLFIYHFSFIIFFDELQGLGRLLLPNRTFDVKQIPVSLTGVKPEFSILAIAAESAFIFSWGVTMPSALKPPRPPSRNKTVQMVSTTRNESCLRAEKGDKGWRMCNMEQTVHLVPVALLACLLILYICSSAQFHGEFAEEVSPIRILQLRISHTFIFDTRMVLHSPSNLVMVQIFWKPLLFILQGSFQGLLRVCLSKEIKVEVSYCHAITN